MGGDRPVVDGRDLLESGLQELVRKVWNDAREYGGMLYGREDIKAAFFRGYNYDIHKLLISYFDREASDVGTQDEASEAREMGDSVRPKSRLIPRDPNAFVVDEWDPIRAIDDKFAREMELRFSYEGKKVAIGHCDLSKTPDGSIHAHINFFPQNPR